MWYDSKDETHEYSTGNGVLMIGIFCFCFSSYAKCKDCHGAMTTTHSHIFPSILNISKAQHGKTIARDNMSSVPDYMLTAYVI